MRGSHAAPPGVRSPGPAGADRVAPGRPEAAARPAGSPGLRRSSTGSGRGRARGAETGPLPGKAREIRDPPGIAAADIAADIDARRVGAEPPDPRTLDRIEPDHAARREDGADPEPPTGWGMSPGCPSITGTAFARAAAEGRHGSRPLDGRKDCAASRASSPAMPRATPPGPSGAPPCPSRHGQGIVLRVRVAGEDIDQSVGGGGMGDRGGGRIGQALRREPARQCCLAWRRCARPSAPRRRGIAAEAHRQEPFRGP